MTFDREKNAARIKELDDRCENLEQSRAKFNEEAYRLRKPGLEYTSADWKSAATINAKETSLLTDEIKAIVDREEFLGGDRLAELKANYEEAFKSLEAIKQKIIDGLLEMGYLPAEPPIRGSMSQDFWLRHPDYRNANDAIQDASAAIEHLHSTLKVLKERREAKFSALEKLKLKLIA